MIVSASAPGKVLILGGYEIVEAPNIGISVGVTARFTTLCNSYKVRELHNFKEVEDLISKLYSCETHIEEITNKYDLSECKEIITADIHSPQFNQSYMFVILVYKDMKTVTTQCKGERTPFLQNAIHFTIASITFIKSSSHEENATYQDVKATSTNCSAIENNHNKFMKNTTTLSNCKEIESEFCVTERTVSLQLLADNDFYSQRNYLESLHLPVTVNNLRSLPVHLPLLGKISKTGLGSSASMTTSVVACLYYLFLTSVSNYRIIDNDNYNDKETIHRIAQIAHNISQGKIGSGFDVYTAVYGTSAYRRFPECKISKLSQPTTVLEQCKEGNNRQVVSTDSKELKECLDLNDVWVKHVPFSLPKGVHLILGDVHKGGSSTPGMVAKIMAWRQSENVRLQGENSLWCKLSKSNEMYVSLFKTLIEREKQCKEDYIAVIKKMQTITHIMTQCSETKIEELFVESARCANNCRRYLREIGNEAGVSFEPPELTKLLDETMTLPGVLAVGCPGAGGYDAIFALVIENEDIKEYSSSSLQRVEEFWQQYTDLQVCPLLVREDAQGLLVSAEQN